MCEKKPILKVKLKDHQIQGVGHLLKYYASGLNFETGTGKSLIQITSAYLAIQKGMVNKVILVGSVSSCLSLKEDLRDKTNIKYTEIETINDVIRFVNSETLIGIMSYNKILKFDICIFLDILRKLKIGFSFDEVHTLSNKNTKMSTLWNFFRPQFGFCWGLTATLYRTELLGLFNICNFISPGFVGNEKYFKSKYIEYTDINLGYMSYSDTENLSYANAQQKKIKIISNYKNLESLYNRVGQLFLGYFPSQKVNFKVYSYQLDKSAIKDYKLISSGINPDSLFDNHLEVYDSVMKRLVELQHFLNKQEVKKTLFTKVLREKINSGVVIYGSYYKSVCEIESILKLEKIPHKIISGAQSESVRIKNKKWFTEDSKGKALIITDAGGQSLNLQATNHLFMYDIPYGVGKFLQIRGRIVRVFSDFNDFYIHMFVGKHTFEDYKLIYLQMNESIINNLQDYGKIPPGEYKDYSYFIAKSLRQSLIWKG